MTKQLPKLNPELCLWSGASLFISSTVGYNSSLETLFHANTVIPITITMGSLLILFNAKKIDLSNYKLRELNESSLKIAMKKAYDLYDRIFKKG